MKHVFVICKVIYVLLVFSEISCPRTAFAKEGHGGGNGGGIQYCETPANGQKSLEFYDLKEIRDHLIKERQRTNFNIQVGWKKEDYFNRSLEKVAKSSARLASQLRLAYEFYNTTGRIQNSDKHILERTGVTSIFCRQSAQFC